MGERESGHKWTVRLWLSRISEVLSRLRIVFSETFVVDKRGKGAIPPGGVGCGQLPVLQLPHRYEPVPLLDSKWTLRRDSGDALG